MNLYYLFNNGKRNMVSDSMSAAPPGDMFASMNRLFICSRPSMEKFSSR